MTRLRRGPRRAGEGRQVGSRGSMKPGGRRTGPRSCQCIAERIRPSVESNRR